MSASRSPNDHGLPGAELSVRKMPGHWLLARLGKRVLRPRPGGLELTRRLLSGTPATSLLSRRPRRTWHHTRLSFSAFPSGARQRRP